MVWDQLTGHLQVVYGSVLALVIVVALTPAVGGMARLLGVVDRSEGDRRPNPRGVPKCVRVLLLYNTPQPQSAMRFAYLRGAQAIKADLDYLRGSLKQ